MALGPLARCSALLALLALAPGLQGRRQLVSNKFGSQGLQHSYQSGGYPVYEAPSPPTYPSEDDYKPPPPPPPPPKPEYPGYPGYPEPEPYKDYSYLINKILKKTLKKVLYPCKKSWKFDAYSGRCYYYQTAESYWLTWYEARETCRQLGGYLASIHSTHDDWFIRQLCTVGGDESSQDRMRGCWIGGYSLDHKLWRWDDGTSWGGVDRVLQQYDNPAMTDQCLAVDHDDLSGTTHGRYEFGEYRDYVCNQDRLPFACYKYPAKEDDGDSQEDDGSYEGGGSYESDEDGYDDGPYTSLFSPNAATLKSFAKSYLYDPEKSGKYERGYESDGGSGYDSGEDDYYNDEDYKKVKYAVLEELAYALNPCEEGWVYDKKFDYCYRHDPNKIMNWDRARADCIRQGADLASFHSRKEQQFLNRICTAGNIFNTFNDPAFGSFGGFQCWSGGYSRNGQAWAFSDGTPFDVLEHIMIRGNPEPSDACLLISPDDLVGADSYDIISQVANNCLTLEKGFICKKEPLARDYDYGYGDLAGQVAKAVEKKLHPCKGDWIYNPDNKKCYSPPSNDLKNYYEAWASCHLQGATLPSFHNRSELLFLSECCARSGIQGTFPDFVFPPSYSCWLGATSLDGKMWVWDDYTRFGDAYEHFPYPWMNPANQDSCAVVTNDDWIGMTNIRNPYEDEEPETIDCAADVYRYFCVYDPWKPYGSYGSGYDGARQELLESADLEGLTAELLNRNSRKPDPTAGKRTRGKFTLKDPNYLAMKKRKAEKEQ